MNNSSSDMSNLKYIYVNIKMCPDIHGKLKGRNQCVPIMLFLFVCLFYHFTYFDLGFYHWAPAPKTWPPAPLCSGAIYLHPTLATFFCWFLTILLRRSHSYPASFARSCFSQADLGFLLCLSFYHLQEVYS